MQPTLHENAAENALYIPWDRPDQDENADDGLSDEENPVPGWEGSNEPGQDGVNFNSKSDTPLTGHCSLGDATSNEVPTALHQTGATTTESEFALSNASTGGAASVGVIDGSTEGAQREEAAAAAESAEVETPQLSAVYAKDAQRWDAEADNLQQETKDEANVALQKAAASEVVEQAATLKGGPGLATVIKSNHQTNAEGVAGVQYIPFEDGDEWSSDIGQQAQAHMSLGERVAADESPAV